MEVKKSKKAAIETQRGTWLLMGFVATLAFMFVTFEWTQHDIKGKHPIALPLIENQSYSS